MATFSVTDRQTYKRCRLRWDFSSNARRNLTGVGSGPENLELGGLIHRALAEWIVCENPRAANLGHIFLQIVAQREDEVKQAFQETYHRPLPDSMTESLHNVTVLGTQMMLNYQEHHKTPVHEDMVFAVAEQEVVVPVPGTEHACPDCVERLHDLPVNRSYVAFGMGGTAKKVINAYPGCKLCGGKGYVFHYLSATLDGLLRNQRDQLLVLEHKTYENRPNLIDLEMMDQFTGYCWVVDQLDFGMPVIGVAYDGMWKRAKPPQRPKPLALPDLFIRKILYKSPDTIQVWGENLAKEINEMANNPEIYPTVPWNGCGDCAFRDPCIMMLHGEDPTGLINLRYIQRTVVRGGGVRPHANIIP